MKTFKEFRANISNNLLEKAIINKGSIKSKSTWKKAHSALQKMEKEFKGTKKEKDYYEVLNSIFPTVDDWTDGKNIADYTKKTATARTYGDDPIADLRYDLKNLLGSNASKILEGTITEAKLEVSAWTGRKPPAGIKIVKSQSSALGVKDVVFSGPEDKLIAYAKRSLGVDKKVKTLADVQKEVK